MASGAHLSCATPGVQISCPPSPATSNERQRPNRHLWARGHWTSEVQVTDAMDAQTSSGKLGPPQNMPAGQVVPPVQVAVQYEFTQRVPPGQVWLPAVQNCPPSGRCGES